VADEDDPARIHPVIDELRLAVDRADQPRERPAVRGPWPGVGELNGQAVHAPGRRMYGLVSVIRLRVFVSVQEDDERRFFSRRRQVAIRGHLLGRRYLHWTFVLHGHGERSAVPKHVDIGPVIEQVALQLAQRSGLD
jgi:hypothetical protein